MQPLVTELSVKNAINQLESQGKIASLNNIRAITGGCNNTIIKIKKKLGIDTGKGKSEDDLLTRIDRIEKELTELKNSNHTTIVSDNTDMVAENNILKQEIANLRRCVAKKDAEIAKVEKALEEEKLQDKLFARNSSKIQEIREELKEREAEVRERENELAELEDKEIQIGNLEKKIEDSEETIAQLNSTIEDLKHANSLQSIMIRQERWFEDELQEYINIEMEKLKDLPNSGSKPLKMKLLRELETKFFPIIKKNKVTCNNA